MADEAQWKLTRPAVEGGPWRAQITAEPDTIDADALAGTTIYVAQKNGVVLPRVVDEVLGAIARADGDQIEVTLRPDPMAFRYIAMEDGYACAVGDVPNAEVEQRAGEGAELKVRRRDGKIDARTIAKVVNVEGEIVPGHQRLKVALVPDKTVEAQGWRFGKTDDGKGWVAWCRMETTEAETVEAAIRAGGAEIEIGTKSGKTQSRRAIAIVSRKEVAPQLVELRAELAVSEGFTPREWPWGYIKGSEGGYDARAVLNKGTVKRDALAGSKITVTKKSGDTDERTVARVLEWTPDGDFVRVRVALGSDARGEGGARQ